MKQWKYNSILMILSISLVLCSTTFSKPKSKESNLNDIEELYQNIETASLEENKSEQLKDNKQTADMSIETKSFSEISSSKSEDRAAPSKKVAVNYKLEIKDNPLFKSKDKQLLSAITKYEKCVIKEGVIDFVIGIDNDKKLLSAHPVRVLIEKNKLSLYSTENSNSLFSTTNLDEIRMLIQKYPGTSCFNLVVNKLDSEVTRIEKDKIILCGVNAKEWMQAINEFKECSLISASKLNPNSKIVVDFNKVNELIKEKKRPISISQSTKLSNNGNTSTDDLKHLYYDNGCKSKGSSPLAEAENKQMKKEIRNIYSVLKEGSIAEQQLKRELKDKLEEVKKETKLLEHKKDAMERVIQKKEQEEKNKLEIINTNKKKLEEVQLLKAVTHRLKTYKEKDLKQAKKDINRQIKLEKNKASLNAQAVMKMVDKKERLRDFSKCVSDRLLNFFDKEYVKNTCLNIFGKSKEGLCEEKTSFCKMCCEFYIGFKHLNTRVECKDKCNSWVNGKIPNQKKGNKNNKKD